MIKSYYNHFYPYHFNYINKNQFNFVEGNLLIILTFLLIMIIKVQNQGNPFFILP